MRGKRGLSATAGFHSKWEVACVDLQDESWKTAAARWVPTVTPRFTSQGSASSPPCRCVTVWCITLIRVLEPLFEPRFLEDSFACRKGKGTHAGMRRALQHACRQPYALKCDLERPG